MKHTTRAFLFAMTLAASLAAQAQYQWVDHSGRRVFSDQPPPADIPARNILKQPGVRAAPAAPAAPAATAAAANQAAPTQAGPAVSAAASAASAASAAGQDKALEERKQKAEAAEAAKKKAEEAKLAAQRADNCKRARAAKASLDSGVRIARTNEKGEREILDDAQRAAEARRIDEIIQADCR